VSVFVCGGDKFLEPVVLSLFLYFWMLKWFCFSDWSCCTTNTKSRGENKTQRGEWKREHKGNAKKYQYWNSLLSLHFYTCKPLYTWWIPALTGVQELTCVSGTGKDYLAGFFMPFCGEKREPWYRNKTKTQLPVTLVLLLARSFSLFLVRSSDSIFLFYLLSVQKFEATVLKTLGTISIVN